MDNVHNLIEFLKRPIKLATHEITDVLPNILLDDVELKKPIFTYTFPRALLTQSMYREKLAKFEYFKADIHLKFTINTSPMTSGQIIIVYAPYDDLVYDNRQILTMPRVSISAFPHVILDCQSNTAPEMIIPYLKPEEAYSLTLEQNDYATLYAFPLTDLRNSTESKPLQISIFANFDNITLSGPTKRDMSNMFYSEHELLIKQMSKMPLVQLKRITAEYQIGEQRRGPISEIATNISNVAEGVSTLIPISSTFTKPISWLANTAGKVASIFGWAKVNNVSEPQPFVNIPGRNMYHIKNIDNSTALALNQDYQLTSPENIFQTANDEMQIEHVCANPAVIGVFTWKARENFLHNIPVNMAPLKIEGDIEYVTPYQYIAKMFKYGRATFCYKFKAVKTPFHSGRLNISFDVGNTNIISDKNDEQNYRTFLDLRTETEVTIKIPYILDKLFMNTQNDRLGNIQLKAISDLIANEAVENSIDIVVWAWIENPIFMDTAIPTYLPYFLNRSSRIEFYWDNTIYFVEPELDPTLLTQCVNRYNENTGFAGFNLRKDDGKITNTGLIRVEKISTSIQQQCVEVERGKIAVTSDGLNFQLVGRNNRVPVTLQKGKSYFFDALLSTDFQFDIQPYTRREVSYQINLTTNSTDPVIIFGKMGDEKKMNKYALGMCGGDYIENLRSLLRSFQLSSSVDITDTNPINFNITTTEDTTSLSYISHLYRMSRGGRRMKILTTADSVNPTHYIRTVLTDTTNTDGMNSAPFHITFPFINNFHEISVPFYDNRRRNILGYSNNLPLVQIHTNLKTARLNILTSGDDDLTFGWLVGPPPIVKSKIPNKW